ncbi:MAG: hypothetical protein RIS09_960 [Actinomycetota bacterium]|jgi:lactoylglutathione lyase
MRLGYVVIYVEDPDSCVEFWTKSIGFILLSELRLSDHTIRRVGLNVQGPSIELVPMALMKDNPDGLDLATPSLCFYVDNIQGEHNRLKNNGVEVSEIVQHFGKETFAFSDNEERWFAVMEM